MSRPVTGRDAVSPLPDHRVATEQAAFGLSQQSQSFVEAALVGLFPKGCPLSNPQSRRIAVEVSE